MPLTVYTCKNCGNTFQGKYCNICGEKTFSENDKKISHFFEEGFHFITHFEGTFFTTIKTMFSRPGKLSLDISNGTRKRYFKPLSLFILLVVVYLIFPYFEGLNMQLKYYASQPFFGKLASLTIKEKIISTGLTDAELASLFHQKAEKLSKFLLIIIVPLTALALKAITFRRKKYFFDYLVFSAEVNAFYILWGFLITPLLHVIYVWVTGSVFAEYLIGYIIVLPFLVYVLFSIKYFFKLKWWHSTLITLIFAFMHQVIIQIIYKLILFEFTMYQIN